MKGWEGILLYHALCELLLSKLFLLNYESKFESTRVGLGTCKLDKKEEEYFQRLSGPYCIHISGYIFFVSCLFPHTTCCLSFYLNGIDSFHVEFRNGLGIKWYYWTVTSLTLYISICSSMWVVSCEPRHILCR